MKWLFFSFFIFTLHLFPQQPPRNLPSSHVEQQLEHLQAIADHMASDPKKAMKAVSIFTQVQEQNPQTPYDEKQQEKKIELLATIYQQACAGITTDTSPYFLFLTFYTHATKNGNECSETNIPPSEICQVVIRLCKVEN